MKLARDLSKLKIWLKYQKQQSQKELFDYINGSNSKPKIAQKCRNELVRRGIKIVMVPIET